LKEVRGTWYLLTVISETGLECERERDRIKKKIETDYYSINPYFDPFKLTRGIKFNIILQLLMHYYNVYNMSMYTRITSVRVHSKSVVNKII